MRRTCGDTSTEAGVVRQNVIVRTAGARWPPRSANALWNSAPTGKDPILSDRDEAFSLFEDCFWF